MDLTLDHKVLEGARATRRYFTKFERIMGYLKEVAALSESERLIDEIEAQILQGYLDSLARTFTALSNKYLMANRIGDHAHAQLSIDKVDSGFPIYQEILQMAADALQADEHIKSLPSSDQLKKDMVTHILDNRSAPVQLQYALSQRLYYQAIKDGSIFLSQNHPQAVFLRAALKKQRRAYVLHWASYDSQTNLPAVYIMEVEDSAVRALPKDERRWPRLQSYLMAQSLSSLNLLTIARGFDRDFNDLHPKKLRRFHVGPMYSHKFTEQRGPLRQILADASGKPGLDWALSWKVETLQSDKVTKEKTGMFTQSDREVFKVDKMTAGSPDAGATEVMRALILPHRAYQVLEEKNPPGFRGTRKYVVGENSKILSYS